MSQVPYIKCSAPNCENISSFNDGQIAIRDGWRITGVDPEGHFVALCPSCAPELAKMEEFHRAPVLEIDDEIILIQFCYDKLRSLPHDGQQRVLDWLISRIEYDRNKPPGPVESG